MSRASLRFIAFRYSRPRFSIARHSRLWQKNRREIQATAAPNATNPKATSSHQIILTSPWWVLALAFQPLASPIA
jgi:hypothetical protein